MAIKLKIKKGDTVRIIAGDDKEKLEKFYKYYQK